MSSHLEFFGLFRQKRWRIEWIMLMVPASLVSAGGAGVGKGVPLAVALAALRFNFQNGNRAEYEHDGIYWSGGESVGLPSRAEEGGRNRCQAMPWDLKSLNHQSMASRAPSVGELCLSWPHRGLPPYWQPCFLPHLLLLLLLVFHFSKHIVMLLLKSGSAAKCWRVFTTQATLFRFKFPVGVSLLILASEQVPRWSTDAPRMLHGFSARQMPERGSQQILADLLPIFSGNQRLNYQHSGDGERERRREEEEEGGRGGRKRRKKEEEILIKLEECCEGCCEGCCERFRWRCRGRFDRSMQSWWRSLTDDFWPVTFKATPPVTIQSIFNESIIDNNGPSMSSWSNQQSVASSSQTSSMKS